MTLSFSLTLLCCFAFAAGLIDAAVGGGGLIQIPALFNILPNTPPPTLLGSNKLTSMCGTSVAAASYVRRIAVPWRLVLPATLAAFGMSFAGAAAVAQIPPGVMRPVVLVLLILMAVYTFAKKDFGTTDTHQPLTPRRRLLAVLIGGAIGFYDGLFGPGTGSFLIFLFIRCFRMDFVRASACAKVLNLSTNAAALLYFIPAGQVMYGYALPMALCNIGGAVVGTRLAMQKGAGFVRVLFLILLVALIGKLGYDVLHQG